MMKLQQIKDGKVIFEVDTEHYNFNVHQFIENGATKITIEYPTSTIIVTPSKEKNG